MMVIVINLYICPMRKIRENSVAAKMVERIENGEEKSVSEWSKALRVPPSHIRSSLTALRRRGYLYFPVGTVSGFNGESKEGKIMNITDSLKHTKSTIDRYHKNHLKPSLFGMFAILIESIQTFPQLADTIQELTENTLYKVMEAKQELKLKSGKGK